MTHMGTRLLLVSSITLGLFLLFLFQTNNISSQNLSQFFNSMPSESSNRWSSPISGFIDRAEPYQNPSSRFQPPRSSLELAVLRNAPIDPEGFTLAIFSSDSASNQREGQHYAVTSTGKIYVLKPVDASSLLALARTTLSSLPTPDSFRNTWVLDQPRTSQPINRILLPRTTLPNSPAERYPDEYSEVSVQGFNYSLRKLREEVEGLDELPDSLFELTGVVLEAKQEGSKDEGVVNYVKGLLGNVY